MASNQPHWLGKPPPPPGGYAYGNNVPTHKMVNAPPNQSIHGHYHHGSISSAGQGSFAQGYIHSSHNPFSSGISSFQLKEVIKGEVWEAEFKDKLDYYEIVEIEEDDDAAVFKTPPARVIARPIHEPHRLVALQNRKMFRKISALELLALEAPDRVDMEVCPTSAQPGTQIFNQ